jgi:cell division protein FtsX
MKKRYPWLVNNRVSNPLPDALTVKLSPRVDRQALLAHLRARHLGGVAAIR